MQNTTVRRQRPKLVPDKEYLFTHKRKQTFRAVFKRIVRAPSSDTMDEFYFECEVDAALSGNPWTDFRRGSSATILLRPSLITIVQDVPRNATLRNYVRPLGQGNTPRIATEESWMKECIAGIRSVFRNLRRT
ncbi:MAG TPA: hypothetical protein DGH68_02015 [Bacteroidetes bacterium]|nr:hypothetical protein [Bacteroidota bacterium]